MLRNFGQEIAWATAATFVFGRLRYGIAQALAVPDVATRRHLDRESARHEQTRDELRAVRRALAAAEDLLAARTDALPEAEAQLTLNLGLLDNADAYFDGLTDAERAEIESRDREGDLAVMVGWIGRLKPADRDRIRQVHGVLLDLVRGQRVPKLRLVRCDDARRAPRPVRRPAARAVPVSPRLGRAAR